MDLTTTKILGLVIFDTTCEPGNGHDTKKPGLGLALSGLGHNQVNPIMTRTVT
jgi:hypothetical protein